MSGKRHGRHDVGRHWRIFLDVALVALVVTIRTGSDLVASLPGRRG